MPELPLVATPSSHKPRCRWLQFGLAAMCVVSLGCGRPAKQPRPAAPRRTIRIEELTDNNFRLDYVQLHDYNYCGKRMVDDHVAPGTAVARKSRAILTWLVALDNIRERDRSVLDDIGESQRSVALINKVKGEPSYRIAVWGPKDGFGPTDYPVEIRVCSDGCVWARTVISDREIERRLDDLFDEAFKSKAGDSQESMPPGSTLNGREPTGVGKK